jgi:hypothetical protein
MNTVCFLEETNFFKCEVAFESRIEQIIRVGYQNERADGEVHEYLQEILINLKCEKPRNVVLKTRYFVCLSTCQETSFNFLSCALLFFISELCRIMSLKLEYSN